MDYRDWRQSAVCRDRRLIGLVGRVGRVSERSGDVGGGSGVSPVATHVSDGADVSPVASVVGGQSGVGTSPRRSLREPIPWGAGVGVSHVNPLISGLTGSGKALFLSDEEVAEEVLAGGAEPSVSSPALHRLTDVSDDARDELYDELYWVRLGW